MVWRARYKASSRAAVHRKAAMRTRPWGTRPPATAAPQVGVKVPLVVRLEGTNVDKGKEILKTSGMAIITADDLDDAAQKAVASLKA